MTNISLPSTVKKIGLAFIVSIGMIFFAITLTPSEAAFIPSENQLPISGIGNSFQTNGADCDYYISPTGSNTASGASETDPWATFSYAISDLNPGDTLCVMDGTYDQSLYVSRSGNSSNPITIRAVNDGKVMIDGQGTRKPVYLDGSYVVIEGITAQNSSGDVYDIRGSYNTLRRCTGYNAHDSSNNHVFDITRGNYILVEDCAGSGVGRYIFLNYESTHSTLRRCFAKWQEYNSSDPMAGFCNYGAAQNTTENCIAINAFPPAGHSNSSQDFIGFKQTYNDWNGTNYNYYNKYYGNISLNNATGFDAYGGTEYHCGNYSEYYNNIVINSQYSPNISKNPWAFYADAENITAENMTLVNNSMGLSSQYMSGSSNAWGKNMNFKNFLFINNTTAINSAFSWNSSYASLDYVVFYGNGSNGSLPSMSSHIFYQDPQFNSNQTDYPLYIPDGSPLKGAGEGGADIGANIIYQYKDGVLTNDPLWPWPMEERICDELGISVTWKSSDQISRTTGERCTGGYWEDLSEIYDLETPREDINQDGSVNILDLQLCVNVIIGQETNPDIVARADVSGDGLVNVADVQKMLEIILTK